MWLIQATEAISKNNTQQTIDAMNQIIVSPNFNDYSGETLEYFDRVYQEQGVGSARLRNIASIGAMAASSIPGFGSLSKFCKNKSKERADIAELCLGVGKRLAGSGSSLIYQLMGLAFQKAYHISQNDHEAVNAIENEMKGARYGNNPLWFDASNLLVLDEALSNYWFKNYIEFGEVKSNELLIEEAIRLSSDENYNPCPNGKG